MNNREFDAMLRRRIAKEAFDVNPKVENVLRNTLLHPEFPKAVRRGAVLAVAGALLVCTAAFALTELTARPDQATSLAPETATLSHGTEASETKAPGVTMETLAERVEATDCVRYVATRDGENTSYHVTLHNPFDQPLLVGWAPAALADGALWPPVTSTPSATADWDAWNTVHPTPTPTLADGIHATPTPTPVTLTATPTPAAQATVTPRPTSNPTLIPKSTPPSGIRQHVGEYSFVLLMPGETVEDAFWTHDPIGGEMGLSVIFGLARKEMYVLPTLAGRSDEDYATEQIALEKAWAEGRVLVAAGRMVLPDSYQTDAGDITPLTYYVTANAFELLEGRLSASDAAWAWLE